MIKNGELVEVPRPVECGLAINNRLLNEVGENGLRKDAKSLIHLNLKEKQELEQSVNRVKYEKKLQRREKMVYDALTSDRSKYGSKLRLDETSLEVYEDP